MATNDLKDLKGVLHLFPLGVSIALLIEFGTLHKRIDELEEQLAAVHDQTHENERPVYE